jgi:hypothetical protein
MGRGSGQLAIFLPPPSAWPRLRVRNEERQGMGEAYSSSCTNILCSSALVSRPLSNSMIRLLSHVQSYCALQMCCFVLLPICSSTFFFRIYRDLFACCINPIYKSCYYLNISLIHVNFCRGYILLQVWRSC